MSRESAHAWCERAVSVTELAADEIAARFAPPWTYGAALAAELAGLAAAEEAARRRPEPPRNRPMTPTEPIHTPARPRLADAAVIRRHSMILGLLALGHAPAASTPVPTRRRAGDDRLRRPEPEPVRAGRNAPCPCGSGKKAKRCCRAVRAPQPDARMIQPVDINLEA